jgi:hypothetical protein
MLFLQGARDDFAETGFLNPLVKRLGALATLCLLPDADHSFHMPARSTYSGTQIKDQMLTALANWVDAVIRA